MRHWNATQLGALILELEEERLVARAGIAVGSPYQYSGSRSGLLDFAVALCARSLSETFSASEEVLAAMPLGEALGAYVTTGVAWSQAQAGLTMFLVRADVDAMVDLVERGLGPVEESSS